MTQKYLWIPMLSIIILLAACSQAASTTTSLAEASAVVSTSIPASPRPINTPTPTFPPPLPTSTPTVTPQILTFDSRCIECDENVQPQDVTQTDFTVSVNALQRIGKPGKTITYTLWITNNGPQSSEISIGANVNYGDDFPITGISRDRYDGLYRKLLYNVEPNEQQTLDITVKIPQYATQGMVHIIDSMISSRPSRSRVELELTTVVSQVTAIERVAHIGLSPQDVFVQRQYAYLAAGEEGLRILDISDPANPIEVDAFGADNMAMDVAVANGYIYLANVSGGLHILRYPK